MDRLTKNANERLGKAFGSRVAKAACSCALVAAMAPATALALEAPAPADTALVGQASAVTAQVEKAEYGGAVTASLKDAATVELKGYSGYNQGRGANATKFEAMANPIATITCGGCCRCR